MDDDDNANSNCLRLELIVSHTLGAIRNFFFVSEPKEAESHTHTHRSRGRKSRIVNSPAHTFLNVLFSFVQRDKEGNVSLGFLFFFSFSI